MFQPLRMLTQLLTRLSKTNKKKLSTSSLEKSGELVALSEDEGFKNPYGKHLSAVTVDIFENGLYISATKNNNTKFTRFLSYAEIVK